MKQNRRGFLASVFAAALAKTPLARRAGFINAEKRRTRNRLLTNKEFTRAALMILKENLVLSKLVKRDYESFLITAEKRRELPRTGGEIVVRTPWRSVARGA